MIFKRLVKIGAFIAVTGLMAGCQSDDLARLPDNGSPGEPGKVAYMSINVSLPSAGGAKSRVGSEAESRAVTDKEVGLERENTVKKILLVLADNKNNYCASGVVGGLNSTGASLSVAAEFNQTSIGKFYNADGTLKDEYRTIRVFVFCNPTKELLQEIKHHENGSVEKKDSWVDLVYQIKDENKGTDAVWTDNEFLMSNYVIAERQLPSQFSQWTSLYASADRAFDLSGANGGYVDNLTGRGPVKVERSVARFDFKDGSGNNCTYDIGVNDANQLKVQLVRMGLVNMSKEFYYLRHMSADDQRANTTLLTEENATNFVVDTDADKKKEFMNSSDFGALHTLFHYPLFNTAGKINDNTRTQWDNYLITDVLGKEEDNADYAPADYHIWRYVTENTLPEVNSQVAGLSTGVVFKGKLLAGEGLDTNGDLYKAINGTYQFPGAERDFLGEHRLPVLYLFQNNLYVGWNCGIKESEEYKDVNSSLYKAATTAAAGGTKSPDELYQALLNNTDDADALAAFREAATAAGFTLYQASKDDAAGLGYYFYYYYWNRHRDNNKPGEMGPMEFATVRNHVYKLSVTKISKIGYPRIQDNNPDPLDPEDPDEDSELYISVAVEVLPWVVCENKIEF